LAVKTVLGKIVVWLGWVVWGLQAAECKGKQNGYFKLSFVSLHSTNFELLSLKRKFNK
jgi:hypothetical protein